MKNGKKMVVMNGQKSLNLILYSLPRSLPSPKPTMRPTMVLELQPSAPSPQLPISTGRVNKSRANLTASIESEPTKIVPHKTESRGLTNLLKFFYRSLGLK